MALGEETVTADANTNVTGNAGTGQLGTVAIVAKAGVNVTGVQGTGQTQTFTLVWGEIDTAQTPNWTEIAA